MPNGNDTWKFNFTTEHLYHDREGVNRPQPQQLLQPTKQGVKSTSHKNVVRHPTISQFYGGDSSNRRRIT
jgi:hypothetical protein